jgi:sucrose-phosphate synthase
VIPVRVLASDIDGTLLEGGRPTAGLGTLRLLIDACRRDVRLVYATGRSFGSTWGLVSTGALPVPDAIAPCVGTEVWMPPWGGPDRGFAESLARGWDREAVVRVAGDLGIEPQPARFQTPLKASFYLSCGRTLETFRRALDLAGVGGRVVHSGGRFLDVLPRGAGKLCAIRRILDVWGARRATVLTAGDSMNDVDMIADPSFMGVVVGNAEMRGVLDGTVYESSLPYAAGVLEGAEAWRFWPS